MRAALVCTYVAKTQRDTPATPPPLQLTNFEGAEMRMPGLISLRSLVKRFVMVSIACVAGLSMPAMAQQAPAAPVSDTSELEEIVVTGSMIKRVNAETAEAVTILKADALKDQGVTTVEQ